MNAQSRERIAQALLHEMDLAFQRYYHQSLNDVVQDLTMRNILRGPDPSAEMLLQTIRESGILRMSGSDSVVSMRAALDRYARGTLELCARCGSVIDPAELERHPLASFCSRCRGKNH
ncbi:MAG: hypothetical protein HYW57_04060 [Ignavibacteriales bacterium]|nr:hypothetical protein [Ignavibacteriales bacterium]